jgi:hypothetical protein
MKKKVTVRNDFHDNKRNFLIPAHKNFDEYIGDLEYLKYNGCVQSARRLRSIKGAFCGSSDCGCFGFLEEV